MANAEQFVNFRDKEETEGDVQDGHVTEENADEQRTDRGGYRRAVHAPRRWLLENTRFARARRKQVTTNHFEFPKKSMKRK